MVVGIGWRWVMEMGRKMGHGSSNVLLIRLLLGLPCQVVVRVIGD